MFSKSPAGNILIQIYTAEDQLFIGTVPNLKKKEIANYLLAMLNAI